MKLKVTADRRSAADFLPESRSMRALRAAAATCRGCDLFRRATQTVFGEGSSTARLMLVGETPGDREDIEGHPFVGAAGRLLDEALAEARIDRRATYVTNVVKHFKWTPRGKRRLHARPSSREIMACRPWLDAEIGIVEPPTHYLLGCDSRSGTAGPQFPNHTAARRSRAQAGAAEHFGDVSSLGNFTRSGQARSAINAPTIHR